MVYNAFIGIRVFVLGHWDKFVRSQMDTSGWNRCKVTEDFKRLQCYSIDIICIM